MNIKNFAMIGISHKILSMQEREEFIRQKPKVLLEELFKQEKFELMWIFPPVYESNFTWSSLTIQDWKK